MLFNSIEFFIFLPIVFCIYWFLLNKHLKIQNLFLLIASFVFYGWWDWRFLMLLVFSAGIDFFVGSKLVEQNNPRKRKLLLSLSLLGNLGILVFFKYFNFFAENFVAAFTFLGSKPSISTLKIVLPVGISFYTFQALSYTIDIYKRQLQPTKSIIDYYAFISFFPQLVAGPIERAANLLPQFTRLRTFDYEQAKMGLRYILWGLFKKMVIADTCAVVVNMVFKNPEIFDGSILLLSVVFFSFQIYCDFSGYSDIAIGVAKLFGFNLMRNFENPYFSSNISQFWQRWHISLSTWFRDYVYIPLGGSRVTKLRHIINVIVTFTLSGFWHGANWTYVAWGALNGIYYIPCIFFKIKSLKFQRVFLPFQVFSTYLLILIAWVFFRSASLKDVWIVFTKIASPSLLQFSYSKIQIVNSEIFSGCLYIMFLLIAEFLNRKYSFGIQGIERFNVFIRWSFYFLLLVLILFNGNYHKPLEFIYFQF